MTVFFPAPDLCPLTYFLLVLPPSSLPLLCIPLLPYFPLTSRPSRIVNIEHTLFTPLELGKKRTGEIVLWNSMNLSVIPLFRSLPSIRFVDFFTISVFPLLREQQLFLVSKVNRTRSEAQTGWLARVLHSFFFFFSFSSLLSSPLFFSFFFFGRFLCSFVCR